MKTTKGKIADTVDDLKANVTSGASDARDKVSDSAAGLRSKLADTTDALGERAKALQTTVAERLPETDGVANVLPLLIGSAVVGFAAGLLLPLSEIEKERLQPIGDEIARAAFDARDVVVTQGQAVVEETFAAARESVRAHGQAAAESLGMTESEDA